MYAYTYDSGVCEKITPEEKKTREHVCFENTKSGAGEQFLLLDCRARACARVSPWSRMLGKQETVSKYSQLAEQNRIPHANTPNLPTKVIPTKTC